LVIFRPKIIARFVGWPMVRLAASRRSPRRVQAGSAVEDGLTLETQDSQLMTDRDIKGELTKIRLNPLYSSV
jgi:hypothetical protein